MADGISFSFIGLKEVQAAIAKVGTQIDQAAHANAQDMAAYVIAQAKSNIGARPGPLDGKTGHLKNSIHAEPIEHVGMGEYGTQVGPSMIYGRRVELGFLGTDSIGREYKGPTNPAKYPFLEPAAIKLQQKANDIAAANWAKYVI